MEQIFKNIEEIRKEKGIKQIFIAKQMGVTQAAYSNYVNRNEDISMSRLTQIANIFRMSVIDVLTYPIKYVPETESCEECQKKEETIENLNELIKLINNKKRK